jgi:alpha-1,3-mannosyltransferase
LQLQSIRFRNTRAPMKRLDDDLSVNVDGGGDKPLIVHVVRQFLPNRGGLEDVVYNLCRQALLRGFRIRVVTLNSLFSDPALVLAKREVIDGIEVVRITWKGSSRYPVAPSVLDHIKDADLVHVHALDFFYDFLALTSVLHRKPMIATTHGGFFHTRRLAAVKAAWFQTLTRFSSSRYRYLVGCSRSDIETFEPIAHRNLRLIENGADTAKFHDLAAKVPVKRMITIGRFSANKRLDRLVAALRALVAIDPTWSLDIVGVPSNLTVADVQAMARGIEAHINVHAGLANEAIGRLIAQNSLFVSASEYEGFGLVAIEAMSAGLVPVLQDNSAYTALAATHKRIKLGNFANAADGAQTILAAWAALQVDPTAIRALLIGEADAYSWSRVAERYFSLYHDILDTEPAH